MQYLFYKSFSHQNPTTDYTAFLGAFAGAFFAFIFGLVAYRVTKRWERFVQHQNSLVKLDRMLNRHLDLLSVLEEMLGNICSFLEQKTLTGNRLFKLEVPESLDIEIGSVIIVNKFFSYRASIDRLNYEVSSANHSLTRFEDIFISGQSLGSVNTSSIVSELRVLQQKKMPQLINELKLFLATVRINLYKIQGVNFLFFYGVFNRMWNWKICQSEISTELVKLNKEIELVQKMEEMHNPEHL